MNVILQWIGLWISLIVIPFSNFSLLWRMLPVYLNGLLATIYFGPSNTAAVFGGLTALWAGADWIRVYILEQNMIVTQVNWIIAVIFAVYGIASLIVGFLKMERHYKIFGRRSILTYFALSIYPIQAGYIMLNKEIIIAIIIMAIPIIALLELIALIARKGLKVSTQ